MKLLSYQQHQEMVEIVNAEGNKLRVWFIPGANTLPAGYDLAEHEKERWNGVVHKVNDNGTLSSLVAPAPEPEAPKVHTMPKQKVADGDLTKE
jgi:hypothetical protein